MKKLLAIGLVCCLPTGLAAEDPVQTEAGLGTMHVMVIEETAPVASDVVCTRGVDRAATECMAVHRAVLTARIQKVSALSECGRWM